jgi:hypothetical protein
VYKIELRSSGFLLTFGGAMDADEMRRWRDESRSALRSAPKKFGVLVDMRDLVPLSADAQAAMVDGQALYKQAGMERSAVILKSAALTLQFKRLAKESGIYSFERYLDASARKDWQDAAIDWVKNGKDPDA